MDSRSYAEVLNQMPNSHNSQRTPAQPATPPDEIETDWNRWTGYINSILQPTARSTVCQSSVNIATSQTATSSSIVNSSQETSNNTSVTISSSERGELNEHCSSDAGPNLLLASNTDSEISQVADILSRISLNSVIYACVSEDYSRKLTNDSDYSVTSRGSTFSQEVDSRFIVPLTRCEHIQSINRHRLPTETLRDLLIGDLKDVGRLQLDNMGECLENILTRFFEVQIYRERLQRLQQQRGTRTQQRIDEDYSDYGGEDDQSDYCDYFTNCDEDEEIDDLDDELEWHVERRVQNCHCNRPNCNKCVYYPAINLDDFTDVYDEFMLSSLITLNNLSIPESFQ